MDLDELNVVRRDAGLEPLAWGAQPDGWHELSPTTITEYDDRGQSSVERFRDTDALCRRLLVQTFVARPPRPGAHGVAPPVPQVGAATGPLERRWWRPFPDGSRILARAHGTLALLDTSPLHQYPRSGAAQVCLVTVATGEAVALRLWPGGTDQALTAATGTWTAIGTGPLLLLSNAAGMEVVEPDGSGRWVLAWEDWPSASRRVDFVGEARGVLVLRADDGQARGVSARDGHTVWVGPLADPVFAQARDRPAGGLVAFWSCVLTGRRLQVDRVDFATGARTTVAAGELPSGYADADPLVIVDRITSDGSGHLVVRCSIPYRPGGPGQQLGDLVVTGGGVFAVDPQPRDALGGSSSSTFLTDCFAADRLFHLAHYNDRGSCRLTTLDGRTLWEREGGTSPVARSGEITVVHGRGNVEGIADDGSSRWRVAGDAVHVPGDDVLVDDSGAISCVSIATGALRWEVAQPWPPTQDESHSRRWVGGHLEDGMLIRATHDEGLVAYTLTS